MLLGTRKNDSLADCFVASLVKFMVMRMYNYDNKDNIHERLTNLSMTILKKGRVNIRKDK